MWPWEHVVVGYVAFSIFSRLVYRAPPGDWATLAVVFGSLLPDLVDKPLAWQFGVFETGYALAHSVFIAVPVCAAVWLFARRRNRGSVGAGFTVGYLAHLPADVIPYYLLTGRWMPERILWPVRTAEPARDHQVGVVDQMLVYFIPYLRQLLSGDPSPYLVGVLAFCGFAFVLWVLDGTPGIAPFVDGVSGIVRRLTP